LDDAIRVCRCTPMQIARYRDRLSGPLRDRLDMTVDVPALPPDALQDVAPGESSAAVRTRVVTARERQRLRYGGTTVRTNAELTAALMSVHATIDADGRRLLTAAMKQLSLSARGYDRVRKVARTIADLASAESIAADHLAEALQFRMVT
jgi:magnesium chelatase family protein